MFRGLLGKGLIGIFSEQEPQSVSEQFYDLTARNSCLVLFRADPSRSTFWRIAKKNGGACGCTSGVKGVLVLATGIG